MPSWRGEQGVADVRGLGVVFLEWLETLAADAGEDGRGDWPVDRTAGLQEADAVFEFHHEFAGDGIPDLGGVVVAGRCEVGAIRGKCDSVDRPKVTF